MADAILLTGGGSNADVEGQQVTNTDVYPGDVFLDLDGTPATGSMATLGAQTIQPKNTNQTISAGRYLVGAQTIAPVVVANLSAANVKQGITIGVGYAGATGAIATAAGTFTNDANATKNGIRSGYKGWVKGQEIVGELGSVAAKTWSPSTAIQTISGSTYYGGAQKLNAIPGNANSAQVVNNYTFGSTNGANLTGSIPVYTRSTPITPSTATQTITTAIRNHYVTSDIKVSSISATNFVASNIKKGTVITAGGWAITGTWEGYVGGATLYNKGSWMSGLGQTSLVGTKAFGYNESQRTAASMSFASTYFTVQSPWRHVRVRSSSDAHRFGICVINKAFSSNTYGHFFIECTYSGTGTPGNNGFAAFFPNNTSHPTLSNWQGMAYYSMSADSAYVEYYPNVSDDCGNADSKLHVLPSEGDLTGFDLNTISHTFTSGYIGFLPWFATYYESSWSSHWEPQITTNYRINRIYLTP